MTNDYKGVVRYCELRTLFYSYCTCTCSYNAVYVTQMYCCMCRTAWLRMNKIDPYMYLVFSLFILSLTHYINTVHLLRITHKCKKTLIFYTSVGSMHAYMTMYMYNNFVLYIIIIIIIIVQLFVYQNVCPKIS